MEEFEKMGNYFASLGKGYYEFCFSSVEDARSVRMVGSWNLNPGYWKLFAWTHDFNSSVQKSTSAQVWLRIFGLGQEYWRTKILFAIASSVENPICINSVTGKNMFERIFGHFVRVLVDVDLANELKYKVLVERKGYAMFVDFEYENLPEFCNNCSTIGRHESKCRKLKPNEERSNGENKEKFNENNRRKDKEPAKEFAPTGKTFKEKEGFPVLVDLEEVQMENVSITAKEKPTNEENDVHGDSEENRTKVDNVNITTQNVEDNDDARSRNNVDASSDTLEFVEAIEDNEEEESVTHEPTEDTPERIQKDMNFLKQSWANLADQDVEEVIRKQMAEGETMMHKEKEIDDSLRKEDLQNLEASGFQIVLNRSTKKKLHKAAATSSKSQYSSRSKTGSSKLSK